MADKAAEISTQEVRATLDSVIRDANKVLQKQNMQSPIDIEITFRALKLSKKGFLVFSKNKEEQVEIRIATRVMPPVDLQA